MNGAMNFGLSPMPVWGELRLGAPPSIDRYNAFQTNLVGSSKNITGGLSTSSSAMAKRFF